MVAGKIASLLRDTEAHERNCTRICGTKSAAAPLASAAVTWPRLAATAARPRRYRRHQRILQYPAQRHPVNGWLRTAREEEALGYELLDTLNRGSFSRPSAFATPMSIRSASTSRTISGSAAGSGPPAPDRYWTTPDRRRDDGLGGIGTGAHCKRSRFHVQPVPGSPAEVGLALYHRCAPFQQQAAEPAARHPWTCDRRGSRPAPLQRSDATREGGLRQPQRLGGAREVPMLADGQCVLQGP